MSPAASSLGVAAPSALPPPAAPPPPAPPPVPVVTNAGPAPTPFRLAWPSAAQAAVALLAVLTLGLLGWHAYARSRWATRPTALQPGDAEVFRVDLNTADAVMLMHYLGEVDKDDHGTERGAEILECRVVPGVREVAASLAIVAGVEG